MLYCLFISNAIPTGDFSNALPMPEEEAASILRPRDEVLKSEESHPSRFFCKFLLNHITYVLMYLWLKEMSSYS